tara:strand:- start:297 stop:719 length:423 start_codon:yes stop_codon:yes gene_type:complete
MGNDAIKEAITKHLQKNNTLDGSYYAGLVNDANQLNALREDVDNGLLELKKHIISSNLHLIVDRIFKGENEEVIKMIKNTRNKELFFDFTEEFNKFLILFEQYTQNLEFDSPDISDLKETFALNDQQVFELINEINLDNK